MKTARYNPTVLLAIVFLALSLGACVLEVQPTPSFPTRSTSRPAATRTLTPAPETRTPKPTATPTPLPSPDFRPSGYPSGYWPSPLPVPTTTLEGEINRSLDEFHRVRAEAERTLNPDLLNEVCMDPYLSQKAGRIRANAQDGSYWDTGATQWTTSWLEWDGYERVHVWITKVETKFFYPRGAARPDDETCGGTIYSYRNCAYDTEYYLVRSEGRWYVSEAIPHGDCRAVCQQGLPTATPTPSPAPTTTPQPAPTISFPAVAVEPAVRPALPTDLYFLRNSRLWRWPAAGGDLVLVRAPHASASDEVVAYRFSPDGNSIAYLTAHARLYVLDRRSGAQRFPSGPGESMAVRKYEFSADGRYLLYVTPAGELHLVELAVGGDTVVPTIGRPVQFALAWEDRYLVYLSTGDEPDETTVSPPLLAAMPAGEPVVHGTLLAVDLQGTAQPYELGFCGPDEGASAHFGCAGFLLSPDGRRAVLTDDRGVWLVEIPQGNVRLLVGQRFGSSYNYAWCGAHVPLAWFPDGERLLEQVGCQGGGGLAVLSADNGLEQGLPQTECFYDCLVEWFWGPEGLWVSPIPGTLYMVRVSFGGFLYVETSPLDTETHRLWPTEVHALADGRVFFAHQRCAAALGGADAWPAAGLFALESDGAVRRVWPLPSFPCPDAKYREGLTYPGTLLWTADGDGFLYLDAAGRPMLLGLTDGSVLWDMRGWLRDAEELRWGP
jgi:hypothetical protein